MRKLLLILGILLVFAATASAQVPAKPFTIYAGGGISLPTSPDEFKDAYKMGFHGSGGIGFNVAPMFQVVGKVEYHTWSFDFDELAGDDADGFDGGTFKALMFGADGRFAIGVPAAPIKPFVFGGVGMANVSVSDLEYDGEVVMAAPDSETKFYFNFGGGVEFNNFFIQARYVSIATEGDAMVSIPITLGVKF